MRNLPFDKPGRFFRGNLHTHTTQSDGERSVDEVIGAYQQQGYDFISITDHFMERFGYPIVDTRSFRSDCFTTIIGAELHAPQLSHGERWHILANGLPLDFAPPSPDENGPEIARRAAAAGAFVTLAHPGWYSLSLADALTIDTAHAVEIYNHTVHHHNDRGDSSTLVEQLLMNGRRLHILATDDAHFSSRPDHFGGWVHVKSESLDPEALLSALKAGHFYASQGPSLLDVTIDGDFISIRTSPVQSIFITGTGSPAERKRGERITDATFPLKHFQSKYCRVTIVDDFGRRAWTNPIWLD